MLPRNLEILLINEILSLTSSDKYNYFINCAVSLDSKLSIINQQVNLSNKEDWQIVHQIRNELLAIIVGKNTILTDDPSLLTKEEYIESDEIKHPIRIVFDTSGEISSRNKIFQTLNKAKLIHVVEKLPSIKFQHHNYHILKVKNIKDLKVVIQNINSKFKELGYNSGHIMIEGGGKLITSFITENSITRMRVFRAPILLGSEGINLYNSSKNIELKLISLKSVGNGIEEIYQLN
jgi:riboflavin-specific deaminase-like protein